MSKTKTTAPISFAPLDVAKAERIREHAALNPDLTKRNIAIMFGISPRDALQILENRILMPKNAPPTPEEVEGVRRMKSAQPYATLAEIARAYHLPYQLVQRILSGKSYKSGNAPARAGRPPKQKAAIMSMLAIDPGKKGAIAYLDEAGKLLDVFDMPLRAERGKMLVDPVALAAILRRYAVKHAAIEQVGSMPTDGHQGAFDFGRSMGRTEATVAVVLSGVMLHYHSPLAWKPYFRLSADKAAALDMARTIWPDATPKLSRHDRAEAALIGLFALQTLKKQGYIAQHAQEPDPRSDPFA